MRPRGRSGFSLVEALIAVVIIALLAGGATFTATSILSRGESLKITQFELDSAHIVMSVVLFHKLYGEFPGSVGDLLRGKTLLGDGLSPWRTPYFVSVKNGMVAVSARNGKGETLIAGTGKKP